MATDQAKKSAPTSSQKLWEAFIKDVDTELSNIYTQKVTAVKAETKELGDFIKSEDTLFTKAVELGGPLPYHKLPNWEQILSADPKHEGIFYKIIFKTLSEPNAGQETGHVDDASLEQILHDMFQQSYNALKTKPSKEEDFIDWIGATIINNEDAIPINLQLALMIGPKGLNHLIYKATDSKLKSPPWTFFEKLPAKQGGKATGIWPEFLVAIKEILENPGKEERDIKRDALRVINKLRSTESSYNPNTEAAARSWVEGSIMGMKPDKILNNERKEELIANLENEITFLFPQPDKAYFYNNFRGILFQNIYEPQLADIKMESVLANGAKTKKNGAHTTEEENGGGGHTGKKPDPTKKESKHPVLMGVKNVLDKWFEQNDKSVDKKLLKALEKSIAGAIHSGLNYSFDNLIEQGSQGALLTATYNRQTITRIADYLTNLLNDLTNDLDKDIPANKKSSLEAAQHITNAAVSYRQFADGLMKMQAAFDSEPVRNTPNYNQVKALMSSANPATNQATSIPDIAQLIYMGNGKPEPQVKIAEAQGVHVAAYAAGLQTSLQRLLNTEQKAAIAALADLESNALSDFKARVSGFDSDVEGYFKSLTAYIQDKQEFEMDNASAELIEQAMENLTEIATTYSD